MHVRVLGPLEVLDRGRMLALGGPKQRALLAVLVLHRNEVVATDRLIDDVWGPAPPATVAKSVQTYVSRLRAQLGRARLVTRPPGYELRIDDDELDLARFERLRESAGEQDPEAAARTLREGLAMWRGPPLADLAYEPFAGAAIARLEDLRLVALEQLFDAELEAGRHAEVCGEIEVEAAAHPHRERLRSQLMLALYRCGRQADALDVYRDTRRALTEELGIEPGRALRDLQAAVLRQDPALDLPRRSPVPEAVGGRAGGATLLGRGAELEALDAALDDAAAGDGRVVLIGGEPGIGKSRLCDELTRRARERGAHVAVGRCWEEGGAPPYWPWIQVLRSVAAVGDPHTMREVARSAAPELAQIVPELADPAMAGPRPEADGEGARFRLFQAVAAVVAAAAPDRPLVLVFDDMHAADEPSLLLLQFVARHIAGQRLLVACAYRDADPALGPQLVSALAGLLRERQTVQVSPSPLSAGDIGRYIDEASASAASPATVDRIAQETGGNPLFVVEIVRLLVAQGRMGAPTDAVGIPAGVRAVISQRIERLSAPCREILSAASVLGREFALEALARLCGLPGDDLLEILDEAVAERVVVGVPADPGRVRFSHALVRDTIYEALAPAARRRLHERAGVALEALYGTDREFHLTELAEHFVAAAQAGDAAKAVDAARRAGDRAAEQHAYEEAARLYELALTLTREPVQRCGLLLALGDARARAGDTPAAKAAFGQAAVIARRIGLPERLALAALGYGGRIIWDVSRDDPELLPLLEDALEALSDEDSVLRVRLLARLAGGPLRDAGVAPERKAALSTEALAMARRLGDPSTLAYAIHGYILGHHSPDHTRRQLELAGELVEVAGRAGDLERVLEGREERLDALVELGDMAGARAELEAMSGLARRLGQPSQAWLVTIHRARIALLQGDEEAAETLLVQARTSGGRAQSWNAEVTYRLQLYVLRWQQGRLAEIAPFVPEWVRAYPTYPVWRAIGVHVAATLGQAAAARHALDEIAAGGLGSVPFDEEWLVTMAFLADAAATIGASDAGSAVYGRLAPYDDRVATSYPEISIGAVAHYLARLAVMLGRADAAAAHIDRALDINGRIGALPWLAFTERERLALAGLGGRDEAAV